MKWNYLRNIVTFLLCAFTIFGIFSLFANRIFAALNLLQQDIFIENEDSEMVQLLLMPTDFPDEFGWYKQLLTTSERSGTSILAGYYNRYEVGILQRVFKVNEPPIWAKDSHTEFLGMPDALNDVYNLQDTGKVDFQDTECLFNLDDTTICRMKIKEADIAFELEINYAEPGNVEAMEDILNFIINAIAKKL